MEKLAVGSSVICIDSFGREELHEGRIYRIREVVKDGPNYWVKLEGGNNLAYLNSRFRLITHSDLPNPGDEVECISASCDIFGQLVHGKRYTITGRHDSAGDVFVYLDNGSHCYLANRFRRVTACHKATMLRSIFSVPIRLLAALGRVLILRSRC